MLRILIADNHPIVRYGFKQIVNSEPDMVVDSEARTAREILALVRKRNCDTVVLDINMSDGTGIEVLMQLKKRHPNLPVLVFSVYAEEQYAIRVLKAGASGYMTKNSTLQELVKAIRKVAAGGRYISSSLAEKLVFDLQVGETQPHESLSHREFRVMCMIASGKTTSEIAEKLFLSTKTVSSYRARILEKMRMKTNMDLTRYVIKNGLIG